MKVYIKHIVIILLSTLAVLSCKKNEPVLTGEPILMSFKEAGQTKALLNGETFAANGNQIQVYDYYYTDANKTESIYINDIATSSGNGTWPFTESHKWTTDGVHKFFGWLNTDNSVTPALTAEGFFGKELSLEDGYTLNIPETTLSPSTTQFDFMYSDIHVRDLNNDPYFTAVPLAFSHLFSAYGVAAKDVAEYNDYILDYIELEGMTETNSATIDYDADEKPVVTYGTGLPGGTPYRITFDGGMELTEQYIDLMTKNVLGNATSNRKYLLSWPQNARSVKLNVGYRAKEINDSDYSPYTKSIVIPNAWQAGKKNNLNLDFKDKEISLNYLVQDWTMVGEEIEFSDQVTVDEEATIQWDTTTVRSVDYTTGRVVLFDDPNVEATCKFTILTPKGATWTASLISKEGHPDAFRFVGGTKYGTVGDESIIKLAVTNEDPISPRHVCELLITVQTADGRTIVVDDALTPEKDEGGNETTYSRFQIVQNLIN